jgi:hypothetical protein
MFSRAGTNTPRNNQSCGVSPMERMLSGRTFGSTPLQPRWNSARRPACASHSAPAANALLDFWQANPNGAYDNTGYTLRGHQYTDANGYYTLTTIVPGIYPGRTEHIHVKVQAP